MPLKSASMLFANFAAPNNIMHLHLHDIHIHVVKMVCIFEKGATVGHC